jgi:sugar/nucleoside kinase (ribokinase family)
MSLESGEFGIDIPTGKAFDAVALGLNAVDHLVLVPHYPQFNTKIQFVEHRLTAGGQSATAMATMSRLGLKTRYIGSVGSDRLGLFQLHSLQADGIESSGVRIVEGAETQTAFIIVDQLSGERTVIWNRDPRLEIDPATIDEQAVTSGRVLHLDGHNVRASIAAARLARSAGVPTCLDIDNIYPDAEHLLPLIDFLISSSTFPERMTGAPDLKSALRQLHDQFGSPFVAATLGDRGVIAYFRGQYIYSPAFKINCRDTTGAGDAFHGGFLYAVLAGYSVQQTLRFANAVAGLKCRELGARTALPSREEVGELLSSHSI